MAKLLRNRLSRIAYLHDLVMAAASFTISLFLRLGTGPQFDYYFQQVALEGTLIFTGVAAIVFALTGLYRGVWRYASLPDVVAIGKAVTITILLFLPLLFVVTRLETLPRSIVFINWFVLIFLLAAPRILYRVLKDRRLDNVLSRDGSDRIPVLLFGAGDDAELFLRAISRRRGVPYKAVGIVAEKPSRVGREIHGVKVMGTADQMAEIVARLARQRQKPRRLVLTKDNLSSTSMRRLYDQAEALGLSLARLPDPTAFRHGVSDGVDLRPIALEDLLSRPQTVLDRAAMRYLVAGKRVLITGAGGSIGSELVRQITDLKPARLALLDNSEFHLYEIDREVDGLAPDLARAAVLADVRDAPRLAGVFAQEKPDLVFHAAALKHVPMVEENPSEGALTNVIGTRNVADACRAAGVAAMVLISTDKAVNPSNVMGATKRLAESYCQALDREAGPGETRFVTVRFGNVLGSTGSVVPLFQKQLAEGGPLTVTHPEVERYFMTIREAVELVLMASASGTADASAAGRIFVLDMGDPVPIQELARQMIRLAGLEPDRDIEIVFTGLRPGEKLKEELLHAQENLVETAYSGILLASPRTADAKLLARAMGELEADARSGASDKVRAALSRLVPEYAPAPLPSPVPGAAAPDTAAAQ